MRRLSMSTPSFFAYWGSRACSASTKAARPPAFCASAMIWRVMVVLPEDSGPKISMTRPRGTPPTPRAASKLIEPVEMTEIGTIASLAPRRMMEPLPNCFSIWLRALSTARARSSARAMGVSPLVDSEHFRTRKDGLKETENANRYRRDCSRKDVLLDRRKSEYLCLRPSLALPVMKLLLCRKDGFQSHFSHYPSIARSSRCENFYQLCN